MSDGFQVTMSSLHGAAGKFRAEAEAFRGAMSANGPAPVDGGNPVIDDALSAVLETVGLLHTQLAGVIDNDAANLDANYREYQRAEEQITALVKDVVAGPGKAK